MNRFLFVCQMPLHLLPRSDYYLKVGPEPGRKDTNRGTNWTRSEQIPQQIAISHACVH